MKKNLFITIVALTAMFANNVSAQSDKGHMCFCMSDGYVTENGDTIQNRYNCGDWYGIAKVQSISAEYTSNNGWHQTGTASGFQIGLGYRFVRNNIPVAASLEVTAGMLSNRTIDSLSTGNSFRAEVTAMLETSHLVDMIAGRSHNDYKTDWLIIGAGLRYTVTNTVYGGIDNPNRTNMRAVDAVFRGTVQLFSFGRVNRYGHEKVMHAVRGFVEMTVPVVKGEAQDWWKGNEADYAGKQNKVGYTYSSNIGFAAGISVQF